MNDFINNQLLGDLNSDDSINIQDVIMIINVILTSQYLDLADMNNDNNVDVVDVVQLVNIILN